MLVSHNKGKFPTGKSVKSYNNVFKKRNSETVMRGNFIITGGKSVLYSIVRPSSVLYSTTLQGCTLL